jgi:hypothetical protein
MSDVEVSHASLHERVCPDCGAPGPSGSFCSNCGLNLSTVRRLPTREEWQHAMVVEQDAPARAAAERLSMIVDWAPGVFDVPEDERNLANPGVVALLERAVASAVENHIPRALRSDDFEVRVSSGRPEDPLGSGRMRITATVAVAGGRSVAQDFDCALVNRRNRAQVRRSEQPRLLAASGQELGAIGGTAQAPGSPASESRLTPAQAPPAARNPTIAVGAGVALLGAALILVGTFLPIRTYGNLPIPQNSFVSDGDWWLIVVAMLVAVAALYFLVGAGRGRGWQVIVPGLAAAAGGIYGLTNKFQHVPLTPLGQQLFGASSVKTSPGVGVYLVLAGGVIGLVGGLMLFRATGEHRTL